MAESYDVVVVGGGHNGLACAGYLAKAGKRVLVLEARGVPGGGCATEEVAAPGFRHNFHSNFHGIIHMGPVYRDLELERYGARYVWPENQFAHVFPDGRAIVCSRSVERTAASISRFSRADAQTFRDLAQVYRDVLEQAFIHDTGKSVAQAVKEIGAKSLVISSDLGQSANITHPDGLEVAIAAMKREGISDADIDQMMRKNPARLLGLN